MCLLGTEEAGDQLWTEVNKSGQSLGKWKQEPQRKTHCVATVPDEQKMRETRSPVLGGSIGLDRRPISGVHGKTEENVVLFLRCGI